MMPDWIKAVISVSTGVIIGVVVEPIKSTLMIRLTARRCEDALYSEIGRIYSVAVSMLQIPFDNPEALRRIHVDDFDYYYSKHRESFRRINQHLAISGLFKSFKRITSDVSDGKVPALDGARQIRDQVELWVSRGYLEKSKLDPIVTQCLQGFETVMVKPRERSNIAQ
jgi:hypothetical protein